MTDPSQYEGWTHEVWLRCRFEETARWQREGDENDPTLACVETEGDAITLCFNRKLRLHDEFEYRFLRLKPG